MSADRARLLISCPDRPGIVAAVAQYLFGQGANIVHSDQHTTEDGRFYMRVEFDLADLVARRAALESSFAAGVAVPLAMDWYLAPSAQRKRLAIFVSKDDHCLQELLWRRASGELPAEIAMVVSNHPDLRPLAEAHAVPFHHVPVLPGDKAAAEARQLALTAGVDAVVLARYMQIISADFIAQYPNRIINIHHSFLPAFVGANPYAQAHARGVKLIGATAHYVTADLDAGPIIEQDVQRVDHRQSVPALRRIGRHVERVVLARAVTWHAEDRILVHGNRTVVFS